MCSLMRCSVVFVLVCCGLVWVALAGPGHQEARAREQGGRQDENEFLTRVEKDESQEENVWAQADLPVSGGHSTWWGILAGRRW